MGGAIPSFFLSGYFFHKHSRFTGHQGKGEAASLTPFCHFRPLHGDLDISRAITAEGSPLHIASSRHSNRELLVFERNSLTTGRGREIKGVFRTQSNIYHGAFLQKWFTTLSHQLFLQNRFIVDARLGSNYSSGDNRDLVY